MMKKEICLISGANPLLLALHVKHGMLEFGEEEVGHIATYDDLNRAVGHLLHEGRIDLLEDAAPFMSKVGHTLLPNDLHIATLVDGHVLPDNINMLGLKFKWCPECSHLVEHRVGHFHTPLGEIGPPVVASFSQALRYIIDRSINLPAQVGIALLQQVRQASLPIETPSCLLVLLRQDANDPTSRIKKMFESLLRERGPEQDQDEEF